MYKLELTSEEFFFLRSNLRMNLHNIDTSETIDANEREFVNKLYIKLDSAKPHIPSFKKQYATRKATEVRSKRAREKIQNAINLLHLENREITHNSIAITGGVSYNTVKKYIPDIDKIGDF